MSSLMRSVIHGSAWLFIANIVTKTLNILLTLVLIRGLGVDDYGFLMTIWGVAALLAGGLDLGMSQVLLRDGAKKNQIIGSFIKHIIAIRIPLTLFIVAIVVSVSSKIIEYSYSEIYFSSATLLVLTALIPVIDSWHFPFLFVCHIFNQFKLIAIYRSLYFASVLLVVAIAVHLFRSVEMVSLSYASVTLMAVILFYRYSSRFIPKKTGARITFKYSIKEGIPFFTINILTLAYMRIELILLSSMLSTYESGVYSAQYQVVLLFYMVPGLVYSALMPSLYKNSKDLLLLRDAFTKLCRYLNLYALVVTPLIIYLAEKIIVIVGGQVLKAEAGGLRLLAFMLLFLFATASLNFLNVLDLLKKRIIFEAAGLTFMTIISMFVVPVYKVNGIAVVAVISFAGIGVMALMCLYRQGIVDFKFIGRDVLKVLFAVGFSLIILFCGTPWAWLNACIFIIMTTLLLSILKFWTAMDHKVLASGLAFFRK